MWLGKEIKRKENEKQFIFFYLKWLFLYMEDKYICICTQILISTQSSIFDVWILWIFTIWLSFWMHKQYLWQFQYFHCFVVCVCVILFHILGLFLFFSWRKECKRVSFKCENKFKWHRETNRQTDRLMEWKINALD